CIARGPVNPRNPSRRPVLAVILTAVVTTLIVILLANFTVGEKKIEHSIKPLYGPRDPQFRRTVGTLLGPPLVDGNTITALQNGDEIFPAMLQAIRAARETISFETYIYWSGDVGRAFA